jgi:adenine-specific DNA-methyltransferase
MMPPMPTLNWLTREQDLKAAGCAPYRLLEHVDTYGDADTDNMLVQGDNLDGLKALLPYYAGQVKCVFIDPPYNTRSAFEHYDDNLEHAQWLAMMYPRLELLRELLSEDGSIWVTLDDNEAHYMKVVMDEIFGRKKFIATISWQNRYSRSNDAIISLSHNFILLYTKYPDNWKLVRNRLPRSDKQAKQYSNPDSDPNGPWRAIPWDAPEIRENLEYPIETLAGKKRFPPSGRHWARTEDQWLEIVKSGRAYFGKSGDGAPSFKQYLSEASLIVPNSWWDHNDAGHTDEAKKEAMNLFERDVFGTPKPERLIQRILHIATNPGDLVLDSFLGSGTTAAVAHKMGRRYIGMEIGEHAVTHCIPRLQKVIAGEQGGISELMNWRGGGGFRFYRLGETLFLENGRIRPDVTFAQLAAHIWFSETRTPWRQSAASPLLGVCDGTAYYLLYNGILKDKSAGGGNVLTGKILNSLPIHDGPKVVYGARCLLPPERLQTQGVIFRHTPYDIKGR